MFKETLVSKKEVYEVLKKYYDKIPESEYNLEIIYLILKRIKEKPKKISVPLRYYRLENGIKLESNISESLVCLARFAEDKEVDNLLNAFYFLYHELKNNVEKYEGENKREQKIEETIESFFQDGEKINLDVIFIFLHRLKAGYVRFGLTLGEYRRLHAIPQNQDFLETTTRLVNYLDSKKFGHLIDASFYLYKKIEECKKTKTIKNKIKVEKTFEELPHL